MADAFVSVKLPSTFRFPMPKKSGITALREYQTASLSPDIIAHAVVLGFKEKFANLAAGEENASDIRKKIEELTARHLSGEWNLPGGGGSDPLGGELFSMIWARLGVPTGARAEMRKLPIAELWAKVADTHAKKPLAGKARVEAAEKVRVAYTAQAEKIIASRTVDLTVDI